MIEQGTDGLLRGGVMGGRSMASFVPLHLNAIDRSPAVKDWLKSWLNIKGDTAAAFLEPKDWFLWAHNIVGWEKNVDGILVPKYKKGVFVWTPPPAVADATLKDLRKARQKHMDSTHVFICPRLMTPLWKQHLHRVAGIIFEIPPEVSFWGNDMHEPLIIGLTFPFLKNSPWQLQRQPAILEVEGCLRRMWKRNEESGRSLLQKLRFNQRALVHMSPEFASSLLQSSDGLVAPYHKTRKRGRRELGETWYWCWTIFMC